MRTAEASDFTNTVVPLATFPADYAVEAEFALLAACLRQPTLLDDFAALLNAEDFLEPACAVIWMVLVNARIECSVVDDDRLRLALCDLPATDVERIVDRLRRPLIKLKAPLKFALEVARLAKERAQ